MVIVDGYQHLQLVSVCVVGAVQKAGVTVQQW